MNCPVSIDTGQFIKHYRAENTTAHQKYIAKQIAKYFSTITTLTRTFLNTLYLFSQLLGHQNMTNLSKLIRKAIFVPIWNSSIPQGAPCVDTNPKNMSLKQKVIYFPCCINRMMGPHPQTNNQNIHLPKIVEKVLFKAGYEIIYPSSLPHLCCGMAFSSKGFPDQANQKFEELSQAFLEISPKLEIPILFDMSPCLHHFKSHLKPTSASATLPVMEPIQFTEKYLLENLIWTQKKQKISVHTPCSSKQMGLSHNFNKILSQCSKHVIDTEIPCCGMAGDRGLWFPELPKSSLSSLKISQDISEGYCNSRTCEMALTLNTGVPYQSLFYLVDECTESKEETKNEINEN